MLQFENKTGIQNTIFNKSANSTNWQVEQALLGEFAAHLKRTLNADFLFEFSVRNVHKPDRNLDIFLRQHFSPLDDQRLSKLKISENELKGLKKLDELLQKPDEVKNESWEYVG